MGLSSYEVVNIKEIQTPRAGSTFTLNASSEAWSPPKSVRGLIFSLNARFDRDTEPSELLYFESL